MAPMPIKGFLPVLILVSLYHIAPHTTYATYATHATHAAHDTDCQEAVDEAKPDEDQSAYIEKLKLLASLFPSIFDHVSDILGKFIMSVVRIELSTMELKFLGFKLSMFIYVKAFRISVKCWKVNLTYGFRDVSLAMPACLIGKTSILTH